MNARVIAFALMGVVLVAGCHNSTRTAVSAIPERHFSLILEHSPSGWAARCEAGCRWKEVAMTCNGCTVRLDVAGIYQLQAPHNESDGFEFTVSRTRDGLAAQAVAGARWKTLTWNCAQGACRARIDDAGVMRG